MYSQQWSPVPFRAKTHKLLASSSAGGGYIDLSRTWGGLIGWQGPEFSLVTRALRPMLSVKSLDYSQHSRISTTPKLLLNSCEIKKNSRELKKNSREIKKNSRGKKKHEHGSFGSLPRRSRPSLPPMDGFRSTEHTSSQELNLRVNNLRQNTNQKKMKN